MATSSSKPAPGGRRAALTAEREATAALEMAVLQRRDAEPGPADERFPEPAGPPAGPVQPVRPAPPLTRRERKAEDRDGSAIARFVVAHRIGSIALVLVLVVLAPSAVVLIHLTGTSSSGGETGAASPLPTQLPSAVPTPATRTPTSGSPEVTETFAGLSNVRSGLAWPSGVYAESANPARLAARFGAWRGAKVDVAIDWGARQSWKDVIDPAELYDRWKGTTYTKVFGVAPIPENAGATMAGCAAGDYNGKWTTFARNIKAAGLETTSVIRLGWEFNGDWYKWQANDPAQFVKCWRQIVTTVRKIAPDLVWDWTVNRGKSQALSDPAKAYPGDAYVDIVGVDSYDVWPGASTEADWKRQYSGGYGLKFWVDFAKEHGRKFSVPEWGVLPGSQYAGHSAGDNAFYIQKMQAFFKSLGSELAYEAYFNSPESKYNASLFGPVQNPSAAAKYKSLFGG